jgi:hypothetical protein
MRERKFFKDGLGRVHKLKYYTYNGTKWGGYMCWDSYWLSKYEFKKSQLKISEIDELCPKCFNLADRMKLALKLIDKK